MSTPAAYACPTQLQFVKVEAGPLAPATHGTYTIRVSGPNSWSEDVQVKGDGTPKTVDLPGEGWYSYTELNPPAGSQVTFNPTGPVEVKNWKLVEVEATNYFPGGKLSIHKVETGSAAPGKSYTFNVDGPGSNDFQAVVAAGGTWTSGWLPLGQYTLSEVGAPSGATISPNPVTLSQDGKTVMVTATNPYPAAKLAIHKVETGVLAPDATYTFDVDGPGSNDFQAMVKAGETFTSGWLPFGQYFVTEVGAPTGATLSPNPAVLDEDGEVVTVLATNPFGGGKLSIHKVETGSAAPGATYSFEVDGPGSNDFVASVKAGETFTSGWLPLGSYLVTEKDAPAGATLDPNPVELTADGATVLLTATNPYPAGKLAIQKVETGNLVPGASYVFQVDGPGSNDFEATVAAGATWTSGWLPLGSYLVTEKDAPEGATLSPNPAELTTDGVTVKVLATNPYLSGKLAIEKVETGSAAPGASYVFEVDGPGSNDFEATVEAGETFTSGWLPLGSYLVTEKGAPEGATLSPNPAELTADGVTVLVTATNPYPAGKLAIEKVETGNLAPNGSYTFAVDGPGSNDFEATVAAGATWTSGWLPLGSYTVTEKGAPAGATLSPNPAELTADGVTVLVTATNPFGNSTTTTSTTAPVAVEAAQAEATTTTTTVVVATLPYTGSDTLQADLGRREPAAHRAQAAGRVRRAHRPASGGRHQLTASGSAPALGSQHLTPRPSLPLGAGPGVPRRRMPRIAEPSSPRPSLRLDQQRRSSPSATWVAGPTSAGARPTSCDGCPPTWPTS
ncbi:MAG: hypothetical protein R2726_11950 [Acidimicrobiales bacterium]